MKEKEPSNDFSKSLIKNLFSQQKGYIVTDSYNVMVSSKVFLSEVEAEKERESFNLARYGEKFVDIKFPEYCIEEVEFELRNQCKDCPFRKNLEEEVKKKQYKALLIQATEGCDYTIACGEKVVDLNAKNIEEAKEKLKLLILEDYNHEEVKLERAELYEIRNKIDVDTSSIYAKHLEYRANLLKKQKEEEERHLYEELKLKYE